MFNISLDTTWYMIWNIESSSRWLNSFVQLNCAQKSIRAGNQRQMGWNSISRDDEDMIITMACSLNWWIMSDQGSTVYMCPRILYINTDIIIQLLTKYISPAHLDDEDINFGGRYRLCFHNKTIILQGYMPFFSNGSTCIIVHSSLRFYMNYSPFFSMVLQDT